MRTVWRLVGITLLALGLLEAGSQAGLAIRHAIAPAPVDDRLAAEVYAGEPWAADYWREWQASRTLEWRSYVGWRRAPFRGLHITVGPDGRRETPSAADTAVTIWMFGGSALWGTGAGEWETIPSFLALYLSNSGVRARIVNFGEDGYVSTQEVLALMLALREGPHPDLVIFYDGVNDLVAAYQGRVGQPQNEWNREREFNLTQPDRWRDRLALVGQDLLAASALVRISRRLTARPAPVAPDRPWPSHETLLPVFDVYQENLRTARLIGADRGFPVLAYWQPTVFDKPTRTPHEQAQAERSRGIRPWVEASRTYSMGGVTDLSGIFRDEAGPIFVDAWHVGGRGNVRVARRMVGDVLALLPARAKR